MTRREEIKQQAEEYRQPYRDGGYRLSSKDVRDAFVEGAKWADKCLTSLSANQKDYKALAVLASRLAESVLMDWDKEEQVKLAKEVACKCHKYFNEK